MAGGLMAAAVAAAVALLAAASAGSAPGDALPDLVSDAPSGDYVQVYADATSTRLLLRFNGFVHNDGPGPLEIRGTGNSGGRMTNVQQRVFGVDGISFRDVPSSGRIQFETTDGHNHFHLGSAMQYALFDEGKMASVVPGMKVGFCFLDSEPVSGSAPPRAYANDTNCEQGRPSASQVVMGVSPGWRDVYGSTLPFQWVDISNVSPGTYWLAARSDPDGVMLEEDEANNGWAFKSVPSTVPGYVARPLSLTAAAAGATAIDLAADRFGFPGPAGFMVVSAPRNGSLDRAVGEVFSGSRVNYTPRAGFSGIDTFVVIARDSTSAFPRDPARATVAVTVNGPAPSVTISGAPGRLVVGTSVQLTATVTGDATSVSWSVDGVPGGNATVGTITTGGLYTAPAAVPAGGSVTIRASSARAVGTVSIGIDPAVAPEPAPAPVTPPAPPPAAPPAPPAPPAVSTPAPAPAQPTMGGVKTTVISVNPLAVPTLSARGRLLLIGLTSSRAGWLRINVLRAGKRLGGCVVKTSARRSVTCSVTLARHVALRGLAVRIGLRVNGRVVATRSAHVSAVSAKSVDGVRTLYCTLR